MIRLDFNCVFLTDVILNAGTATEGAQSSLDFIPGSSFLGILARRYGELGGEAAYRFFHSGQIRFGDAHPLINGMRSHKMPFCFYHEKGALPSGEGLRIYSSLIPGECEKLRAEKRQLVQLREGWITGNGSRARAEKFLTLKSAYDRQTRRSAEAQMFVYEALRRGSQWRFSVELDEGADSDGDIGCLKEHLIGERSLGRSRKAQFGQCRIDFAEKSCEEPENLKPGEHVVYAESRLAFFAAGRPTYTPDAAALGFPGGEILWEKCRLRTFRYAPWNGARKARDADRVCVDKGSVFVVKTREESAAAPLNGIGAYRSEGFGRVLVDPPFLKTASNGGEKTTIKEAPVAPASVPQGAQPDELDEQTAQAIDWLTNRLKEEETEQQMNEAAEKFLSEKGKKFPSITPTQWGNIRNLAGQTKDMKQFIHSLFSEKEVKNNPYAKKGDKEGYLLRGVAAKSWKGCYKTLKEEMEEKKEWPPIYIVKLASLMRAAAAKRKEEEK